MVVTGFDNRDKISIGIITYKIQEWKMKVIL